MHEGSHCICHRDVQCRQQYQHTMLSKHGMSSDLILTAKHGWESKAVHVAPGRLLHAEGRSLPLPYPHAGCQRIGHRGVRRRRRLQQEPVVAQRSHRAVACVCERSAQNGLS